MLESDQPSPNSPQGPIRIVYHAGNRTFARLFNERSLEEVKNVVRKKLGLGSGTDVSLKQMGSDALLDLEDDGDFQAFRFFLKSSVSVDIQVTVGEPKGSTRPPAVLDQSRKPPSDGEPSIALAGTSTEPVRLTSISQLNIPGTRGILPRKRTLPSPDKPPVPASAPITSALVASSTAAESSAAARAVRDIEPPKKKQRKAPTERLAPAGSIVATASTPLKTTESVGTSKPAGDADPSKNKSRKEPADKHGLPGRIIAEGSLAPIKMACYAEHSKKKTREESVDKSASPEPTIVAREVSRKIAEAFATPKGAGGTEPPKKKSVKEGKLPEPVPVILATSGKAAESSATKSVGDVEPPKKKTRKESAKTKSAEQVVAERTGTPDTSTRVAESPVATVPATPAEPLKKPRTTPKVKDAQTTESPAPSVSAPRLLRQVARRSAGQEVAMGKLKDGETPARRPRRPRGVRGAKAPRYPYYLGQVCDEDGTDEPNKEAVDEAAKNSAESGGESETTKDDWTEWLRVPAGKVCAAIPQTGASKRVRSEVAAAILSGYVSKLPQSEPPAPAKRKSIKKDAKKSSASSSALPAEPAAVLDAPADEVPNVPTAHRDEQVTPPDEAQQQTLNPNGPACPICLEQPFHIRYYCPVVLKGPNAIRGRLEELRGTNVDEQQSLTTQLEGLLHELEATPQPSLDVAPTEDVQSDKALSQHKASLSISNVPSHSRPSEVTVQGRDEGTNSDSSDSTSDGEDDLQVSPASQKQTTSSKQPLPSNDALETIIRGPVPKRQSILGLIDRIAAESSSDSDSDEDPAELEEDLDEEIGRSSNWSFMRLARSSDSEGEDEESESLLPSRSVEATPNNPGPDPQDSNKSAEKAPEHQEDVVMGDSADPPTVEPRSDNDSSEETHVGSEDHMAVDKFIAEKGGVEEQPSHPVPEASDLEHLDPPTNGLQTSVTTQADHAPDHAEVSKEVDADPIEPADDLETPVTSQSSNVDPIEAPLEDSGSMFTKSTPKSGISKRIKTRNGQVLDDEADRPVLLEQLGLGTRDEANPMTAKGMLRRESPISQEPTSAWKTPRINTQLPSSSAPAAVALLNHRSKSGTRTGKGFKTPGTQSQERSKDDDSQIAPTPSLARWETLAEPSSPSAPQETPSVFIDELMSSSPHPEDISVRPKNKVKRGPARNTATSNQTESSQKKERLFDLTPSQVPFPYSQNYTRAALVDGKETEGTTDSEGERKPAKKTRAPAPSYRPLSQLASNATLFSPSLPTPTNKSKANGKSKLLAVDDSSSSSSTSDEDEDEDEDEANGSSHIPRGRMAGSALETKKKRQSILSRTA